MIYRIIWNYRVHSIVLYVHAYLHNIQQKRYIIQYLWVRNWGNSQRQPLPGPLGSKHEGCPRVAELKPPSKLHSEQHGSGLPLTKGELETYRNMKLYDSTFYSGGLVNRNLKIFKPQKRINIVNVPCYFSRQISRATLAAPWGCTAATSCGEGNMSSENNEISWDIYSDPSDPQIDGALYPNSFDNGLLFHPCGDDYKW